MDPPMVLEPKWGQNVGWVREGRGRSPEIPIYINRIIFFPRQVRNRVKVQGNREDGERKRGAWKSKMTSIKCITYCIMFAGLIRQQRGMKSYRR